MSNSKLPEGSYAEFVDNLFKKMETPAATLMHASIGLSGESGELLDACKKDWIYGKELDIVNVLEELGDIRFYYQAALNHIGVTDEDIIEVNKAKLAKRYPDRVYKDEHAIARLDKLTDD